MPLYCCLALYRANIGKSTLQHINDSLSKKNLSPERYKEKLFNIITGQFGWKKLAEDEPDAGLALNYCERANLFEVILPSGVPASMHIHFGENYLPEEVFLV